MFFGAEKRDVVKNFDKKKNRGKIKWNIQFTRRFV